MPFYWCVFNVTLAATIEAKSSRNVHEQRDLHFKIMYSADAAPSIVVAVVIIRSPVLSIHLHFNEDNAMVSIRLYEER